MEDDVPEGVAYLVVIDGKLQWVLTQPEDEKIADQCESGGVTPKVLPTSDDK